MQVASQSRRRSDIPGSLTERDDNELMLKGTITRTRRGGWDGVDGGGLVSRQRHERMKNNGDGTKTWGFVPWIWETNLDKMEGTRERKRKKNINRHAVTSFSLGKVVG